MDTRTYDLIVLLDADAPSETRGKIVANAEELISGNGQLKGSADWGTRQTPFQIDHHEEASFHIFQFEAEPTAIEKMDRALKLSEGVLRFRIYKSEPGELPPPPPSFKREERPYERPPDNVAATTDLEEEPPTPAAATEAPAETAAAEAGGETGAEAPAAEPGEAPAPEAEASGTDTESEPAPDGEPAADPPAADAE